MTIDDLRAWLEGMASLRPASAAKDDALRAALAALDVVEAAEAVNLSAPTPVDRLSAARAQFRAALAADRKARVLDAMARSRKCGRKP